MANEWRDTLSYGALAAATVAGWIDPSNALFVGAIRELHRGLGWDLDQSPSYVGSSLQPVNKTQLGYSAYGFCNLLSASSSILDGHSIAPVLIAGASILFTTTAGGPKAVWAAYRDVMWDYPRKKDDGGTTQTQKLKDGIADFIKAAIPAPSQPAAGIARISTALPAPIVA